MVYSDTGTPGEPNLHTLPVELQQFHAIYNNNEVGDIVTIQWITASETDVLGFNVYRSVRNDISTAGNSVNQNLIPAVGSSTQATEYAFDDIDANVMLEYYYWLEVVNFDGSTELLGPTTYTPGDTNGDQAQDYYLQNNLGDIYPNPINHTATISFQVRGLTDQQNAEIKIYNILGEYVKSVDGNNGTATIDVTDISNGIYFYVLRTNSSYDVKRFVVFK